MGRSHQRKLIFLLVCLLLTAIPVLRQPNHAVATFAEPLAAVLDSVPEWQLVRQYPLDPRVVDELQPDDYAFLAYRRGDAVVSLYIGFYRSSSKVGAAHHPLVCFTGQGWVLSPVAQERFVLADGEALSLARMTAVRDMEKLYLTYWFQAHDRAVGSPLRQKLELARARLFDGREENAFVRVSLPMGNRSPAECQRLTEDFLQAFYPVFRSYIRGG